MSPLHQQKTTTSFGQKTTNKITNEVIDESQAFTLRGMTDPALAVFLLVYTVLFCYAKRVSLSPGGKLQRHVKTQAEKESERRSRRVLSILQDPVLCRDLERRLESTMSSKDLARRELRERRETLEKRLEAKHPYNNDDDMMSSFTYAKSLNTFLGRVNLFFMLTLVLIPYFVQEIWSVISLFACFAVCVYDSRVLLKRYGGKAYLEFVNQRNESIRREIVSFSCFKKSPAQREEGGEGVVEVAPNKSELERPLLSADVSVTLV